MHFNKRLSAVMAVISISMVFGFGLSAAPAHAATDLSFQTPIHGGLLLNASNWGGEGSKAGTLANGGVVNDAIDVWIPSSASVASDFVKVSVTGLSAPDLTTCANDGGCFLIEYAPGGTPSGLCVSTVADVRGSFSRLRHCASSVQDSTTGHAINIWQDFAETLGGDQLSQLQAVLEPTPFVLNVKAFGGKGAQVISWDSASGMGSENQLWEEVSAAS